MSRGFADRADAGRRLGVALSTVVEPGSSVVLALPRGGVPVGREVADTLGCPLDVLIVRKIGVPGHRELAMGAVASGGTIVRNEDVIRGVGISERVFREATELALAELAERELALKGGRAPVEVTARTVVLVDDGMATGSTMRAAVEALRDRGPDRVIVAVPVAAPEVIEDMATRVDQVVCLLAPRALGAVGAWYRRFGQTTDEEVRRLLGMIGGDVSKA